MGVFRRNNPADDAGVEALTAGASARRGRLRTTTASVQPLSTASTGDLTRLQKRRGGGWQGEGYRYYDTVGELKYAFNLVAFAISRVRLYVAVEGKDGQAPSPVSDIKDLTPGLADAAARALGRLDHGIGIPELLRRTSLGFQIAGECFLVRKPRLLGTGTDERWSVHSISEVDFKEVQDARGEKVTQYGLRRSRNASAQDVEWLPLGTFVCRMWRSHPEFEYEADSSMLGVLELCDELLLLNQMIRNIARSRLNAGLLYVPDEIALSRETLDDDMDELDAEAFENELMLALSQPVTDESAASSIVPLLIRGPRDLADAIKHITVERGLQPEMVARADRVLERIMQGVDLPKDVVSGLASVKYSNALQIDKSLYTAHVEPLIQLIVQQYTEAYLRPALLSYGFTVQQARRLVIWYDASEILTDTQSVESSTSGLDRFAISLSSWRRENGYSDHDAPDANELVLRLLIQRGQLDDPLTQSLFKLIAPRLMDATRSSDQESSVGPIPTDVQAMLEGADPAAAEDPATPTEPQAAPAGTPGPAPANVVSTPEAPAVL